MRAAGAALILLGGAWAFLCFSRSVRREQALLQDVIAALEQLAGEVRWKNLPLPEGIEGLARRRISGAYFREIGEMMKRNMTLQEAWEKAFDRFPGEEGEILRRLELGGDARQVQGALGRCAEALRAVFTARRESLAQRMKLCAAGLLSAAGLLVVILA